MSGRTGVRVLGLVGPVCAGKSQVARRLGDRGAAVCNADALVRELYEWPEVQNDVRALLGDEVFDASGAVNRAAVADRVFGPGGSPDLRQRLTEQIIFPRTGKLIQDRLREFRAAAGPGDLLVLDAPTLFESGRARWCDKILYVTAPQTRRRQWAAARGWSDQELDRRDQAMIPQEIKRAQADYVIDNSGSLDELHHAVDQLWDELHGGLEKKIASE